MMIYLSTRVFFLIKRKNKKNGHWSIGCTNYPNTRKDFRMIMENENKDDIVIYQTK